ncbi:MAG: hypothetical protein Q9O62_11205 [Ardenticatenia bacterium]|nr:hypothetical protein [Ardenticatenia bacterium]
MARRDLWTAWEQGGPRDVPDVEVVDEEAAARLHLAELFSAPAIPALPQSLS